MASFLLFFNRLYNIEKPSAPNPDSAIKATYVKDLNSMVFGSPTVGGFAGYFKKGMKNIVAHMIPARTRAFRMSFLPGKYPP